ncbi:MAG TPA: ABC transporter substrate-binding protein [Micropepsaceae bacterium]|nr:ABC transporter substrate-binding protein [Micropepsaceae bacterium]
MKLGFGLKLTLLAALALGSMAAPAAAQGLTSLDVALGDVSLNKVPFLIAADAGLYAKNGLDVHQFITPGAAEVARNSGVVVPEQYVKKDIGSAPIDIGGGSPMIYRVANDPKGIHRVLLATTESTIKDHIIASASIGKVEDLKGKRLGYSVPGAVTHVGALGFAKKMGWQPGKDITLVGNGNALNPLKEGREDAFLGSAMVIALAPEMKLKDVIDLSRYNIPVAGSSIMAERTWLASNRDTANRFVTAAIQAIALMKTDRQVFSAALAKWFNIKDKVTQDRMFEFVRDFPSKPYPAVEGIKNTLALYDSPAMKKYKAEDFYDASFITALDKSGAIDRLYK